MQTQPTKKQYDRRLLLLFFGLPLAVTIPVIIASIMAGPVVSMWFWSGVGIGMLLLSLVLLPRWKRGD